MSAQDGFYSLLNGGKKVSSFLAVLTKVGAVQKYRVYNTKTWAEIPAAVNTAQSMVCSVIFSEDCKNLYLSGNGGIERLNTATWAKDWKIGSSTGGGVADAGGGLIACNFSGSPFLTFNNAATGVAVKTYSAIPHMQSGECFFRLNKDKSKMVWQGGSAYNGPFIHDMTDINNLVGVPGSLASEATNFDVAAWSPDGSLLAAGKANTAFVNIYDTTTWNIVATHATPYGFGRQIIWTKKLGLLLMHNVGASAYLLRLNLDGTQTTLANITTDKPAYFDVPAEENYLIFLRPNTSGKGITFYSTATWAQVRVISCPVNLGLRMPSGFSPK